jgi:hypothetical protein
MQVGLLGNKTTDRKRREAMNRIRPRKGYRFEDLVIAAYIAAREITCDQVVAARIVTRVLEDWFMRSGRMDLMARLQSAFL